MSLLLGGVTPRPYGAGLRKVSRAVAATTQIYQGMLVAEIAGAVVPATTSGAGDCIGIAEADQLGGATDGAKRVMVLTDSIFVLTAGSAAPTDATPWGTVLFLESDHQVGTGGLGATQKVAGRFVGLEDNGDVRLYIGPIGTSPTDVSGIFGAGTALTDTATTTIQRVARVSRYLLAGTMSQGETVTLGTTGAVLGDIIRIIRTSTSAQTLTVVNGGVGAGTLCVLVASKVGWAQAVFDGTNWLYDGSSAV